LLQVEDYVLTHSANGGDAALLERRGDFGCGRFQRLFLPAQPDGFNDISGNALGEAAGDGFDFGEFGHGFEIASQHEQPPGYSPGNSERVARP
jgi:hypothetical protein